MVNWTWALENPDFVHLNPSMDTRSEQNTHSVLESRLFDADPHLCDYDYLHSSELGWCGLHLKNDPQQSLLPSYNSWACTAAKHSDFSLLKMHKKDFGRPFLQATGQTDKLRFMGLGVANIPEMAEIERSKGIVQSCQSSRRNVHSWQCVQAETTRHQHLKHGGSEVKIAFIIA